MDGLNEINADLWKDVIDLQAHWIGNCDGVRFEFKLMVCILIGFFALCQYCIVFVRSIMGGGRLLSVWMTPSV